MPLQFNPAQKPLAYDPSGAFIDLHGIRTGKGATAADIRANDYTKGMASTLRIA
jgi:hypothetical protein